MIAQRAPRNLAFATALCLLLAPGMLQALSFPGSGLAGELATLADAHMAERNGDWLKAASLYGQLSRQSPAKAAYRTAFVQCLRLARFAARRDDRNYQQFLEQASSAEALQVLTEVLARLQQSYVDARQVTLERLFRSGVEELELGLRDPSFSQRNFPRLSSRRVTEFGVALRASLEHVPRKPADLLAAVQLLAGRGAELLGVRQALLVLEFAAGACNGLDEHTVFLTPGQGDAERPTEAGADGSVSEPRFLEMDSRIGYLRIHRFDTKTLAQLDSGVARLTASGMRAMILDLRGNGGGLISAAIEVADRFIASGVLVTTRGQVREYNRIYKAKGNANIAVPLVVLIDGETASSAELVAAALRDQLRGTVVGQRSFGKGTIQETLRLRGGIGITLTVAHFLSPRGQAIESGGVEPDLVILKTSSDADMAIDAQLQAALDLARTLSTMGP